MAKLKIVGDSIKNDFSLIFDKTEKIALYTEGLYKKGIIYNKEKIEKSEYGTLHKKEDDGGSAIFTSSVEKVNDEIIKIVNITSPLDSLFKNVTDSLKLVKQICFFEQHSFVRLYPYLDVYSQFIPDLDMRSIGFYSKWDKRYNTSNRKATLSNIYHNPMGKGLMITCMSPVFYDKVFQGLIGLNITIDAIKEKYLKHNTSLMIVDSSGTCIAIDDAKSGIFNIPLLKTQKNIHTVSDNDYIVENLNLLKSKKKEIRKAFNMLIKENAKTVKLKVNDDEYILMCYKIQGLNWFIIKFEKK
ncbi:MAG TPA: hypothetical protein PKK00_11560 [Bacteroidales bacterium]|nr:hypothetical protein [Bacteroidales bacterium]HPS18188.1 hypothetical protein [Bacteroidales bacterium]